MVLIQTAPACVTQTCGVVLPKVPARRPAPFWDEYNLVLEEEISIDCSCKEINLELLENLVSDKRYKMIYLYIIKK